MSTGRRQDNKFVVYTDIIGHTRMFGRVGAPFRAMRERHDALFMDAVRALAPSAIVKGTGDGFYAAFDDVTGALETALAFKYGLATEDWMAFLPPEKRTPDNAIKCRIGVHTGLVNITLQGDKGVDFDGQPRVITEKVMSSAAANQILISRPVRDQAMVNFARREEIKVVKFGEYKFRDVADTVEVWGVADDEAGLGPKPAQAPEHRVIVFAVIDNHAALGESGGVGFTESKDLWDRLFDQTLAEHAQDAFIKRLPEGTLAAFRTAIEATRVARDFRRALKAALPKLPVALAPRIGVDSGLVTFEYSDNRPSDVRDQPVNVAAKIAKVDKPILCNPWQTILTRPVREDAYANLKERDEAKWICLGRKAVPGEPEPIELWDFQDSLTKSDSRTVLWIDARTIRKSAGEASPAWIQFRERLAALTREVLSARAEQPWIIPTDTGLAAAFSNHVEAVAAADELRKAALLEPWEHFATNYRRTGRADNLLRLALAMGPLRVHYEDGQIKDLKGEAVDAVKAVAELAKHGQVLLSRDLMDSVATAFPETEVKWRRVEPEAKTDTEAFEFVRVAKKAGSTRGILIGSGIAAAAVTAAIIGVVYFGGPSTPQRKDGDVAPLLAGLKTYTTDETGLALVDKLIEVYNKRDLEMKGEGMPPAERNKALDEVAREYQQLLSEWSTRFDARVIEQARPALQQISSTDGLKSWIADLARFETLAGSSPAIAARGRWLSQVAGLRSDLESAGLAAGPLGAELDAVNKRIADAVARPWVAANKEALEAEVKAIDAAVGPTGTLAVSVREAFDKWAQANQGQAAAEAKRRAAAAQQASGLSVEVLEPIFTASSGPAQLVRLAGAKADQLAQALSGSTAEKEQAIKPVADALDRLNKNFRQYDFAAATAAVGPAIEAADAPAALTKALEQLEAFRRLDSDPRRIEEWGTIVDALRRTLQRERAGGEAVERELAAVAQRIEEVREVSATVANAQRLKDASAAIDAQLAEGGPVRSAVAAAVKAAQDERQKGLAADQRSAETVRELDRLLTAPAVAGADEPALVDLWKRVRDRLQVSTAAPADRLAEAKAWQAALPAASARVPKVEPLGDSLIARALTAAAASARLSALSEAVGPLGPDDPAALEAAASTAAKNVESQRAAFARLADSAGQIEQALNQAFLLGEPVPADAGGGTLADRVAAFENDPLLSTPGVAEASSNLRGRLAALRGVEKIDSADALLRLAQDVSSPEIRRAVWNRLGTVGGEASPLWMNAQREVRLKVANLASPVTDARRAEIAKEVAQQAPSRWLRYVSAVSDWDALRAAQSDRAAFGVTPEAEASLPASARYNLSAQRLRDAANAAKPDEPALRAAAQQVVDLGGQSRDPKVVEAVGQLKNLLEGKDFVSAGGELPLDKAGPASVEGWTFDGGDANTVTYRLVPPAGKSIYPDQPAPKLTFHRVGPAEGGKGSVYIAATTLSVGHGLAIIDAVGAWGTARGSIVDKDMTTPGSWRWVDARKRFEVGLSDQRGAASWLKASNNAAGAAKYFPAGAAIAPPAPAMPMQYLSPPLAVYLARLAGSRLPSPAEWQAALKLDGGLASDLTAYNLRDESFKPVLEQSNSAPMPFTRIDTHSFTGSSRNDTYPHNDGVPLFAPADQPLKGSPRFAHLVGNVAQWVLDDPDRMNAKDAGDPGKFAQSAARSFAIAGGSALSAVTDPAKLAEPVRFTVSPNAPAFLRGYSDVGVRLAFSTARPPGEESERTFVGSLLSVVNELPPAKPATP